MKTIEKVKVMDNFGVRNQYQIEGPEGTYFQSYESIIAYVPYDNPGDRAYIDVNRWDYSKTTLKYLKYFLEVDSINDIREGIKSGKYILANLN